MTGPDPAEVARFNRGAYDEIADRYAARTGERTGFSDRMRGGFVAALAPCARVLDVGCGPGHVAAAFARAGPDAVGVAIVASRSPV